MLEGVAIVGHIVVVVVGIGEECVASGEHVARREVGGRQEGLLWLFHHEEALVVVGEVLTQLIAQVGVRVPVAHDLHGLCTADAAMIGGHDHLAVSLGQQLEEV